MKLCSIEGCGRPSIAKQMCRSHYETMRMAAIREERRSLVRICRECGNDFAGRDLRAVFCSRQCKERSRNDGTQENSGRCLACDTSLAGKRVDARYCSEPCAQRYRRRERGASAKAARRCRGCTESVPTSRRGNALYCSDGCKIRSRRHEAYALTKEELDLLLEQHAVCAICGTDQWGGPHSKPNVDHDHATGAVRGILCTSCNNGLGRFKDDPALLRVAADYLER